jgi:hypothetical protein
MGAILFYDLFLTYCIRKCSRKLSTPNHWFRKDKTLYKQNGILHMLDRNRMIKVWSFRWAVKRDTRVPYTITYIYMIYMIN